MRIKLVELAIKWPRDLTLIALRSLILNQLHSKGEPLRWAITEIRVPMTNDLDRQVTVEAILIID